MNTAATQSQRDRRGGYALAVVLVFITLGGLFWALSHRATIQALRSEKLYKLRSERDQGVARAVLDGLLILTNRIPSSPETYLFGTLVNGETRTYTVTLTLVSIQAATRTWNVSAVRAP